MTVISHDRAAAACQRLINSHFGNTDQARASIPADPENDDDIVLSRYIEQQAAQSVLFAFKGLQPVTITAIGCAGFVASRMNNAEGQNEYKVTYWLEGKRNNEWFYEHELAAAS